MQIGRFRKPHNAELQYLILALNGIHLIGTKA